MRDKYRKILLLIGFFLMAAYPIYTNYYSSKGLEQYQRHIQFLNKESEYFNPWQYRILMPYTIEAMHFFYINTVDRVIDLEKAFAPYLPGEKDSKYENTRMMLELISTPNFIEYNILFISLRFILHLMIFYVCIKLYRLFIKSDLLILFGLMFISLSMGNSIFNSDLSFNTYMDVLLYLTAGYIIVTSKSGWFIVLISVIGAFNRETAILIPVLFLISKVQISKPIRLTTLSWLTFPKSRDILFTVLSLTLFMIILIGIRNYYGYREPYKWPVPMGLPNLVWNFASIHTIRTIFENIGTYSVLPIVCILGYKKLLPFFKSMLFCLALPWFLVHYWTVVGYESRMFMMPTFLIFLPATLVLLENSLINKLNQNKREISSF